MYTYLELEQVCVVYTQVHILYDTVGTLNDTIPTYFILTYMYTCACITCRTVKDINLSIKKLNYFYSCSVSSL